MKKNLFEPAKYVTGTLVGVDGNAFALLSHFKELANSEDWNKDEIEKVLSEAMVGDYNNLIITLTNHMKN